MFEDEATITDRWSDQLTGPTRVALARAAEATSPWTITSPQGHAGHGEQSPELAAALSRLAEAIGKLGVPPSIQPEALSKEDAAKFLGVSVPTIEHLIRARKV